MAPLDASLLGGAAFLPHGYCFLWQPELVIAHVAADAVIAASYLSIPAGMFVFVVKRTDLEYKSLFVLFAAFIVACGATHIFDIVTLWYPAYELQAGVKLATAAVSAFTAFSIWPIIPQALALPSPSQLRAANDDLRRGNVELARVNAELAAMRDELERRVAERTAELSRSYSKLEAREAYFRMLYRKNPIMSHAIDREGRICEINDLWASMMGYAPEEVMGRRAPEFAVAEPSMETQRSYRDALWATGACHRMRYALRRKDGATFEAEISGVVHSDGEQERAFLVSVDVTDREAAERRLRATAAQLSNTNARLAEREAYYRRLYQINPVMMHTLDREGRMWEVNDFWCAKMGYAREEVIGRRGQDFAVERPPPGEQVRLRSELWQKGFWDRVPYTLKRKDGATFDVEFSAVIHGEGSEARAFLVGADVTAREAAERQLRAKAAELQRANDGLAQFAYVASHDLQEPLRKIVAFSEVLSRSLGANDPEGVNRAVSVMRDSALRARQLVGDLLTYSRSANAELRLTSVDVAERVGSVLADLSESIRECRAVFDLELQPLEVEADPSQLTQLLQNLIANALKYHKRQVAPRVRVTTVAGPDGSSRIEVADEGIGFDARYATVIFEPFKRLHPIAAYPGSGIGLAVCKTICDRHGWRIACESRVGVGSSFRVHFPAPTGKDPSDPSGTDKGPAQVERPARVDS